MPTAPIRTPVPVPSPPQKPIYLDHAATTPLAPAVFAVMEPYLRGHFGNASSVHRLGRQARFAVEESRERVAALIGAEPGEIVFTSGGSEANNAALRGVLRDPNQALVTSAAEHEAVLKPAQAMAAEGRKVSFLRPTPEGWIDPDNVAAALTPDVGLVSLMHVNNETGALSPIADIAARCQARGIPLHTDAVQSAGLYEWTVDALGADLVTMSGHKLQGPKGVGVLYVRGGTPFQPLILGGSQERGRRAGTENVAAIVGFAEAFARKRATATQHRAHLASLRQRLLEGLQAQLGDALVCNTPLEEGQSSPHILSLAFPPHGGQAIDGEMLLLNLDIAGICASAGSACTSGTLKPSHVLLALGLDAPTASAALRFSIGPGNTTAEVDFVIAQMGRIIPRMRLF